MVTDQDANITADMEGVDDQWVATSPYITFTQAPIFMVEELAFEDDQGKPLDYYFAMKAEDIAGNYVLTDTQKTAIK